MLLSGAHTSELGFIRLARRVIYDRIAYLTDRGLGPDTIVCTGSDGSDAQRQARRCTRSPT